TAGTADPLDAGNDPLTARAVLQEDAERLDRRRLPAAGLIQQLEALDVAFVLQDARDVGLEPRRGHIDARVFRAHGVAKPREHVCDWICHISEPSSCIEPCARRRGAAARCTRHPAPWPPHRITSCSWSRR